MVQVECTTCSAARGCSEQAARHRDTAFAWAKDAPLDDCRNYTPRLWRGIPGVLDLPAPLSVRTSQ